MLIVVEAQGVKVCHQLLPATCSSFSLSYIRPLVVSCKDEREKEVAFYAVRDA
jgi:hypothetical protein